MMAKLQLYAPTVTITLVFTVLNLEILLVYGLEPYWRPLSTYISDRWLHTSCLCVCLATIAAQILTGFVDSLVE